MSVDNLDQHFQRLLQINRRTHLGKRSISRVVDDEDEKEPYDHARGGKQKKHKPNDTPPAPVWPRILAAPKRTSDFKDSRPTKRRRANAGATQVTTSSSPVATPVATQVTTSSVATQVTASTDAAASVHVSRPTGANQAQTGQFGGRTRRRRICSKYFRSQRGGSNSRSRALLKTRRFQHYSA